jgi:hypothetical protein
MIPASRLQKEGIMKALLISILCFGFSSSLVFAKDGATKMTKEQYQCIADTLQAYNSSIYYDLSAEDIDTILSNPQNSGYSTVLAAARSCGVTQ